LHDEKRTAKSAKENQGKERLACVAQIGQRFPVRGVSRAPRFLNLVFLASWRFGS